MLWKSKVTYCCFRPLSVCKDSVWWHHGTIMCSFLQLAWLWEQFQTRSKSVFQQCHSTASDYCVGFVCGLYFSVLMIYVLLLEQYLLPGPALSALLSYLSSAVWCTNAEPAGSMYDTASAVKNSAGDETSNTTGIDTWKKIWELIGWRSPFSLSRSIF